jgi:multidrug efflux pump subunit AcrA (membrane-fusion protein)
VINAPTTCPPIEIRKDATRVALVICLTFGVFALWGSFAQLNTGAIAPGEVIPSGRTRTVQHLEGGIVKSIPVREGERVVAGQLLMQLEDVQAQVPLSKLQTSAAPKLAEAKRELSAWNSKQQHLEKMRAAAHEEFLVNEKLYKSNFISKVRLLQLEGRLSEIDALISETASETSRVQLKILELTADLKDVAVLEDRMTRTRIHAPQSGTVSDLRFNTIGGVIPPASKILDIVPDDEALLVEAKIAANDINVVFLGLEARVKLSAYKARSHISLRGRVVMISDTTFRDEGPEGRGQPYYRARIEIPDTELQKKDGVNLVPGMLAEVYIIAGHRSAIRYLFDPFTESVERALHQK